MVYIPVKNGLIRCRDNKALIGTSTTSSSGSDCCSSSSSSSSSTSTSGSGNECNDCLDGQAPGALQVVITGIAQTIFTSDDCDLLNGTFIIDFNGGLGGNDCDWSGDFLLQETGTCFTVLNITAKLRQVSQAIWHLTVTLSSGNQLHTFRAILTPNKPDCLSWSNLLVAWVSDDSPFICCDGNGS